MLHRIPIGKRRTLFGFLLALTLYEISSEGVPWTGHEPRAASLGTTYTVLDPRYSYGAFRHLGESRVGTVGSINKWPGTSVSDLDQACNGSGEQTVCALRFQYEFRHPDPEEFVGAFFTFGRLALETVNSDGTPGPTVPGDGGLDLTDFMHNSFDDGISIEALRVTLRPNGQPQTLTVKFELEDQAGLKIFRRIPFDSSNSSMPVALVLPLNTFVGTIDLTSVRLVSIVVEELNVAESVTNPAVGGFDIEFVGLVDDDGPNFEASTVANLDDETMIASIARRDFEALIRLRDAKTGASLDRTLFRDLLHWGATGWLLASLPAAIDRGWIGSDEAHAIGIEILSFVDTDSLWCDVPVGCLGNSLGVMYRFGGIGTTGLNDPLTGTRKIDVGDVNAVEASVIDTALFQMGAAAFAAGFPDDQTVQDHVGSILDRTRWDQLVDPQKEQFQLGWKPEVDTVSPGFFAAPAPFGGFWASKDASGLQNLTIDLITDEGGMAAILAAGSELHATSAAPWYRMIRQSGSGPCAGAKVTFPGAWFTYTFLSATYLPAGVATDRGDLWGTTPLDWKDNARTVFEGFRTLHPEPGIIVPDFVELPNTEALAQGLPSCAADGGATDTGTRTPYSLQLALSLGGSAGAVAISELRGLLQQNPEQWDPLFGFLDSYHPGLSTFPLQQGLLRSEGRWVQQQVWPLNKGAALLAQLNYLNYGIIWRRASRSNVVRKGIEQIYGVAPPPLKRPGIFRAGFLWLVDANDNRQFDGVTFGQDRLFAFGGLPGDVPVVGDWNGDHIDEVGVYRDGAWYLDWDGDSHLTAADKLYFFGGLPDDVPVVGDWNGDGADEVGLFRGGFFWLLDSNGNGQFDGTVPDRDLTFPFGGVAGDIPVTGDWDGDGATEVGVFRAGFFWVLDANGNHTFDGTGLGQDLAFPFGGLPGDVPLVGDWNGDGRSKVGVFRAGFFWVLDTNGNFLFDGTGARARTKPSRLVAWLAMCRSSARGRSPRWPNS